jgi:hypothetical protein
LSPGFNPRNTFLSLIALLLRTVNGLERKSLISLNPFEGRDVYGRFLAKNEVCKFLLRAIYEKGVLYGYHCAPHT